MQHQLVLQFNGDSFEDYDAMLALEDELIEALGDTADIDGHDIGAGETNIFIFTSAPEQTFQLAMTGRSSQFPPPTPPLRPQVQMRWRAGLLPTA